MVNRIDGNNYYEYRKNQSVSLNDKADTAEKFSLEYKRDSLDFEEKEKKDKAREASDIAKAAEQNGVRLELSNRGRTSAMEGKALETADAGKNAEQLSLADMLRDFIRSAVSAIKGLLYRIWYDSPEKEQDAAVEDVDVQEIGTLDGDAKETEDQGILSDAFVSEDNLEIQGSSLEKEPTAEELTNAVRNETARIDREVQQYLKSGNLSEVVNLLTNDGKRIAAHNSTLLTYYDRSGRMIELSASDKERILHGERSTIKL